MAHLWLIVSSVTAVMEEGRIDLTCASSESDHDEEEASKGASIKDFFKALPKLPKRGRPVGSTKNKKPKKKNTKGSPATPPASKPDEPASARAPSQTDGRGRKKTDWSSEANRARRPVVL